MHFGPEDDAGVSSQHTQSPAPGVEALRKAMDSANIPPEYRAPLIGFFCNELNARTAPPLPAQVQEAEDPAETLAMVCDVFGIGSAARTRSTILANVENAKRRADCLWAVEHAYFVVTEPDEDDPDGEPIEIELLNWGDDPDQYVKRFGEVLASRTPAPGMDAVVDHGLVTNSVVAHETRNMSDKPGMAGGVVDESGLYRALNLIVNCDALAEPLADSKRRDPDDEEQRQQRIETVLDSGRRALAAYDAAPHPSPAPQAAGAMQAEIDRLNAIINTPLADDFFRAVSTEAEHQRQRWGSEHDAGKEPADWFWLLGYLGGKALNAHAAGNMEKAEHHVITTAAACANWHRNMKGETGMRPGIDGEAALASTAGRAGS